MRRSLIWTHLRQDERLNLAFDPTFIIGNPQLDPPDPELLGQGLSFPGSLELLIFSFQQNPFFLGIAELSDFRQLFHCSLA